MDLSEISEFGLIERIAQIAGSASAPLLKGIGDDTAVIATASDRVMLLTSDAMVEGRHFRRDWMTPYQIGTRAAAAALSDIAAMGGTAGAVFCTLCISRDWTVEAAEELFLGINSVAHHFGVSIGGGDTVSTTGPLVLDVVVVGTARHDLLWFRDAARPGDRVLVTGTLGDPAAAIALLSSAEAQWRSRFPKLMMSLTAPTARLCEAAALAPLRLVHAGMDISDGLVQDAGHIAKASRVGITINADSIPVSEELLHCAEVLDTDPLGWAAAGGEDFELLLTAEADSVPRLRDALTPLGVPLTDVGEVTIGSGVRIVDEGGVDVLLERSGWDHFQSPGK